MLTRRRSNVLIAIAMFVVGVLIALSPIGAAFDRALGPARFGVAHRTAGGQVVIIEMDARSAAAIKRWPWSRTNYADGVDHLRQAGAASIVFDVDFSASSDASGDRAFSDALQRAHGLVAMPTFGQSADSSDHRTIDALPIALFRPYVALASVSISPDADGQVRLMPLGTITAGTPRPSLSAYIAQRSGTADAQFPVDMSIDPKTIPRLSFIDVRNGAFSPSSVRGRNILIGATAIEMGDRYGTPSWGVIPGVVVQALAAETLLRGVPTVGSMIVPLLLAALGIALIVSVRSGEHIFLTTAGAGLSLSAIMLGAQHWLLIYFPLAASLGVITLTGVVCALREVVDRFRTQRIVDELTGLPNIRAFELERRESSGETIVVVLLENYESLLAVLGTRASADVVMRVADRLLLVAQGGAVYRTGERQLSFALAADGPVSESLEGLRAILLRPVEATGRLVDITVALGVSTDPAAGCERQHADAAIAAEQAGRDGVFWQPCDTRNEDLERSITLMGELDAALEAGEIEVHYQPKYSLREDRIASVEALVRWPHKTRGFVSPDVFVTLAEKTNRIAPLTLFVLQIVMRDVALWQIDHLDVTAAVNISANLLSTASFNASVEDLLAAAKIPATALIFEVTESAAMSDPAGAVAALRHYRELGIAVSMDDYGTGQSTLTYLRELPLNELKIDRSFVQHAHLNRADAVLVQSTIQMAHELGLKVVAEGIEDIECLGFLRSCGCDFAQGYLISKAVPLHMLIAKLDQKAKIAA
jgi:EAL domain-containing protein (putative c-di-GMP-specific phosphodiesterase class I)/CHASE2 domain-containing sensor protein